MTPRGVLVAVAALVLLAAPASAGTESTGGRCAPGRVHSVVRGKHRCTPRPPVTVQVLAVDDFHGALRPPAGPDGSVVTEVVGGAPVAVDAGGAEYLSTWLKVLRLQHPGRTLFVSVGDLFGDQAPRTVEAFNVMHLDYAGFGESGTAAGELLVLQGAATFGFLAASPALGRITFPPYAVATVGGVRIGVIAATGSPGEAQAVNRYVAELRRLGVHAVVVLLDAGAVQTGAQPTINTCRTPVGPALGIVHALDFDVDVVLPAQTHEAFVCTVDNVLVTSAASHGRVVTQVTLAVDRVTGHVRAKSARNVAVTRNAGKDPEISALLAP
jgi:5'-nucleotidase